MTRARDLADSADKDIAGTLTLDGLDVAGNVSVDTDTLFVATGSNEVGINTSNPGGALDVNTSNNGRFVVDLWGSQKQYYDGDIVSELNWTGNGNSWFKQYTNISGVNSLYNSLSSTGAVFNEDGADRDFRVESDSSAYAFFVDAGVNRVMVGDSAGSYDFNVRKSVAGGDVGIQLSNRDTSQTAGTRALIALQADVDNDGALEEFLHIRGGTSTGGFAEYVTRNGASMRFQGDAATSAVFNDSGADMDFRVESNNHTHALFVDAGNDYVGIDQSAPAYLLDVGNGSSSPSGGYTMRINSNGDTIFSLSRANTSLMSFRNDGAGYVAIASNNGAALMLGYSGNDAGAIANHLHFQSASTVVNEGGQNRDFRVESDSNSTALFVDAGYNSGKGAVLIGSNSAPETGVDYNIAASMLKFSDAQPIMATGTSWNFPSVPSNKQAQSNRWRFQGFTLPYHGSNAYRADASYAQFVCELPNGGPGGKSNLELFEIGFNYGWSGGFYMVEVYETYYTNSGYKRYQFNGGYNPSFDLHQNYGNNAISLNVLSEGTFQDGTNSVPSSATDASYYRKTVRASYTSYRGGLVVLTVPSWYELTPNAAEVDNGGKIRLLNPQ